MIKGLLKRSSLVIGILLLAVALPLPALAETRAEEAQTNAQERRDAAKTRLEDAQLRACENRQRVIKNIMSRIADRGQKQLGLFTKISERVQKFYTDKGLTLSNYDELVADVNAKKAAAQAALDEIKSTSTEFECDGDDPKGVVEHFREALKTKIEALKAYRTSIRNLIVGVKSVQSTTGPAEGEN